MSDHYCTTADITSRLTANGFVYAGDRDDNDGAVSSTELAEYISSAIEEADSEIDAAIQLKFNTGAARGNTFLKWLAADLAAVIALTNGGREAPANMMEKRDRRLKQLREIQDGSLIVPGLNPLYLMTPTDNAVLPTRIAELTTCDDGL